MRVLALTFFLLLFAAEAFAFRVTLLLEHSEPSLWNDLLIAGLKKGGENLETRVVALTPDAERSEVFRDAAASSDLVLVAGQGMRDVLIDNAANYRGVKFGCVDFSARAPNIMAVTFADEQAAFLAGVAAATLAARKPGADGPAVGWLSGADTPAMRSLFEGFSRGARLDFPQTRVIQALVGSFVNPEVAAKKAEWLADRGATVAVVAAGAGSEAARRVLRSRGVEIIDVDGALPDSRTLGAIVKNIEKAVFEIISAAAEGRFRGKGIEVYNLENGGVNFVLQGSGVPARLRERLDELKKEIIGGSIRLQSLRDRTLCDCLD